ncbi:hypothetical protein TSAR_010158 [Trichomalopsis sarcophagae]|uniref:NADH:ubiquinone oxidoreductase intermediate-associated protein 30 domain-containing protein n=1 Tax=Trichomalopsis sarcophagae TaxID=543379 RepID=A0A232FN40_9HYME|nr:hypothetical protein TSAR_010158 [Trichomalopsis sarcophagae]
MVGPASGSVQTLFDFTRLDQLNNWTEHSDTAKPSGMSKAVLVLQKSQLFQRAIFFSLFVPKASGAGFAAIRTETNFDLREYHYIAIKCRGQGVNLKYKMVLRHKGLGRDSAVYGQVFTVAENEFATVKLPLEDFKPYYRGLPLPLETHPLDLSAITNMGIKVDNGPYLPDNQPGVSALEIDWIKAVK